MTDKATSWQFTERYTSEPESVAAARAAAAEWGVHPVSSGVGAQLAVLAGLTRARAIAEVGTGTGVSGLWLLHGAPGATLTTIEKEIDFQQAAKRSFADAGIPSNRTRAILGRALGVLEKLADAAYDLVFIDADDEHLAEYVAQALRIARSGGAIVVAHALAGDRVADPVQRDGRTLAYRTLLDDTAQTEGVVSSLSPSGDGLLTIVRP